MRELEMEKEEKKGIEQEIDYYRDKISGKNEKIKNLKREVVDLKDQMGQDDSEVKN